MLHYCHKTRGAISVFLVIIMLPMMLFSWIMIDMARVKLAHTRVVNATDITLNTALSNFDNIMKDMYGLFAMSQTSDELFENLETYYTKNLMIAGLDEEDAMAFSDNIIYGLMNMSASSEPEYPYTDFLKTEMGSFTWDVSPNASLANPEIMKDQIVNFMKYRAPLGIGMKLIDIIKSFKTVDEQAEVIENKTKYYETQSKLEEHLRNAWGYIERYRDLYQGDSNTAPLSSTSLKNFIDRFDDPNKSTSFYKIFEKDIAEPIANQLLILEPKKDPKEVNSANFEYKKWGFKYYDLVWDEFPCNVMWNDEKMSFTFQITNNGRYTISTLNGNEGENNDNEVKNNKSDLSRISELYNKYWNRMCYNANGSMTVISNIFKMNYSNNSCSEIDNKLDEFIEQHDQNEIIALKGLIMRAFVTDNPNWKTELEEYFKLLKDNILLLDESQKTDHVNFMILLYQIYAFTNKTNDIHPKGSGYKSSIDGIVKPFQKLNDALDSATENLKGAKDELDAAIEVMTKNLESDREKWENSANNEKIKGTEFAEDNAKEAKLVGDKFSQKDIEDLRDVITKKQGTINNLKTQILNIKFCGRPIVELNSQFDYYTEYIKENGNFELYYDKTNAGYQKDYIIGKMQSLNKGVFKYDVKDDDTAAIEFKVTNQLYNYMSNVYKGAGNKDKKTVKEDEPKGKEAKENIQKQNEDLTQDDTEKKILDDSEIYKADTKSLKSLIDESFPSRFDMGSLPEDIQFGNFGKVGKSDSDSGNWKGSTKAMDGAGGKTKDFFKELFAALEEGAEKLRDDLYIEEYIMGMFSYQTIEKEKFIDLYEKELFNNGNPSLKDEYEFLNFHLYNSDGELDDNLGVDLSKIKFDKEDFISKIETLTHIPLSPSNNAQYLNEVEYIIYGAGSSDSVEGTILALRFILNVISAFMNSELRSVARTIAMAIFGYPPLTFLVPIAQIAIIIACAIGESAIDKTLLLAGFKVPVFKSKDNFICSPRGIANEGKKIIKNEAKKIVKKGISYAKSKVEECVSYLSDKADGILDDAQKGTEDFINKQLDKTLSDAYDEKIGGYVDSVTDGMVQLVQQNMNIYLMSQESKDDSEGIDAAGYQSITEGVLSGLKDYLGLNSMDKNGLEYMVKNAAYEYIKENGNDFIKKIVGALDMSKTHEVDELTEENEAEIAPQNSKSPIISIPAKIKNYVLSAVQSKSQGFTGSAVGGAFGKIRDLKEGAVDGVMKMADKGADAFEKAADDFFDGLGDKIPGTDEGVTSDSGKTISLGYSGYLRIFLLIALLKDQDGVLKRTGDIIQLNMRKINDGNEKGQNYTLTKSYCFIDLTVDSHINPLFFSFEGISKLLGQEPSDYSSGLKKMYQMYYHERSGY